MGTYSEYYQNYRGPRLTSAMMYQQDKQIDITEPNGKTHIKFQSKTYVVKTK